MPTLSFFFYLIALALVWLFRMSYHGWFGPYLFWAMIAAPLLIVLLSLPSMLSLRLEAEVQTYITKNKYGELVLRFSSKRRLPVGCVKVWLSITNRFTEERIQSKSVYYGVCTGEQTVPLQTDLCGKLDIQILRWECRDMLGLFRIRKSCPAPLSCTILPPPLSPEQPVDFDAALKTVVRLKPKYGGGFSEEHELRDYRPGDMSNSIHWKLSSKADKLIVREAQEHENKDIFLVLAQVGIEDRGLEVLYWLSLELTKRELPHWIVSNTLYSVGNEEESAAALSGILSSPITPPCGYDPSRARSIFRISSGEVTSL